MGDVEMRYEGGPSLPLGTLYRCPVFVRDIDRDYIELRFSGRFAAEAADLFTQRCGARITDLWAAGTEVVVLASRADLVRVPRSMKRRIGRARAQSRRYWIREHGLRWPSIAAQRGTVTAEVLAWMRAVGTDTDTDTDKESA